MTDQSFRTGYDRAVASYDDAFEAGLAAAITVTISEQSKVTDANVIVFRTGETVSALITVLAGVLAMSPSACRSPSAVRKTLDKLHKRLRRCLAVAECDPDFQEFLGHVFRATDVGGCVRRRRNPF